MNAKTVQQAVTTLQQQQEHEQQLQRLLDLIELGRMSIPDKALADVMATGIELAQLIGKSPATTTVLLAIGSTLNTVVALVQQLAQRQPEFEGQCNALIAQITGLEPEPEPVGPVRDREDMLARAARAGLVIA